MKTRTADELLRKYYPSIQSNSKNKMAIYSPIIITRLIDDGVGVPFSRAFSPFEFFDRGNLNYQQEEFIERVHNWVRVNNYVFYRPYHINRILTPLAERTGVCYFSTYNHVVDDDDMLIHYSSPIYFNAIEADDYAATQPNLIRKSCIHEFV